MTTPVSAPLGSSGEKRRRAFRRGRKGELLAMLLLCLKGYRILARDFRVPMGEVDIVARHRRTLAFVEVKSRNSAADGILAVTPRQQQRISRAAAAFVGRHPHYRYHVQRFDIIVVAPWRWPRHIISAWFGW